MEGMFIQRNLLKIMNVELVIDHVKIFRRFLLYGVIFCVFNEI